MNHGLNGHTVNGMVRGHTANGLVGGHTGNGLTGKGLVSGPTIKVQEQQWINRIVDDVLKNEQNLAANQLYLDNLYQSQQRYLQCPQQRAERVNIQQNYQQNIQQNKAYIPTMEGERAYSVSPQRPQQNRAPFMYLAVPVPMERVHGAHHIRH